MEKIIAGEDSDDMIVLRIQHLTIRNQISIILIQILKSKKEILMWRAIFQEMDAGSEVQNIC